MSTQKISITDFSFLFHGHGHYSVTYKSPVTGKKWATVTSDMPLVDATRNEEYPKKCDLIRLKKLCKS